MSRTDVAAERAPALSAIELERIVSLARAAELTDLSQDTLRRRYKHFIRRLSRAGLG